MGQTTQVTERAEDKGCRPVPKLRQGKTFLAVLSVQSRGPGGLEQGGQASTLRHQSENRHPPPQKATLQSLSTAITLQHGLKNILLQKTRKNKIETSLQISACWNTRNHQIAQWGVSRLTGMSTCRPPGWAPPLPTAPVADADKPIWAPPPPVISPDWAQPLSCHDAPAFRTATISGEMPPAEIRLKSLKKPSKFFLF